MKKFLKFAIMLAFLSSILGLSSAKRYPPLITVPKVDLDKYAGKWYEIARFPSSFQKNCNCTSAEYSFNEDGSIRVDNKCQDSKTGKLRNSIGKAKAVKGTGNASLKVSFFWPFKGDYNIIALDEKYQYAMVGTESRKYCWILSRTKNLNPEIKNMLLDKAKSQGFETSKFIWEQGNCKD